MNRKHRHDPYKDAPDWALELASVGLEIAIEILIRLDRLEHKDQNENNEIYNLATNMAEKLDAVLDPSPAAPGGNEGDPSNG